MKGKNMFENLMYAIRTEKRNGKVVEENYITPAQYLNDFFKNLYYREVHGNRSQHRCEYAHHRNFDSKCLQWEAYGNGYKCEWLPVAIPRNAGNREREIIENMTDIEHIRDGEHDLIKMYAVIGDDVSGYDKVFCVYDESTGKFVG